jgi:hypothetical protein
LQVLENRWRVASTGLARVLAGKEVIMRIRMWLCVLGTLMCFSACAAIDEETPVGDEIEEVAGEPVVDGLDGHRSVGELAGSPGEAQSHPLPYCNRYDGMPCLPGSPPRICYLVYPTEPGICYCSASSGKWECD